MTVSTLITLFMVGMCLLFVVVTVLVVRALVRNPEPGGVQAIEGRVVEVAVDADGNHRASIDLADGTRQVFLVTESQAAVLGVGAAGTVHFAGDRLTGWVPQGTPIDRHQSE